MTYEEETRAAYQSEARAAAYRWRHTKAWSWARFATAREHAVLARVLRDLHLGSDSCLLDVPCGTGILGAVVAKLGCRVVAADIATEMMALARGEYEPATFRGFIRSDILRLPFAARMFDCVVTLGFLHRVPAEIRRESLREIASVSRGAVVVTCSLDDVIQRLKTRFLRFVHPRYVPAPHRAALRDISAECAAAGLRIVSIYRPVPVLSADAVLVLTRE